MRDTVNRISSDYLYRDLYTGELLTKYEAIDRAEIEYGFDFFTPVSEFWEYFEQTNYELMESV